MVNGFKTTQIQGDAVAGISATEAARGLGVSRPTFFKWIDRKKVKVTKRVIGTKTHYEISEQEYERLKSLMVKKRQKGKSVLRN